jgi:hypothetical protein
MTSGEKTGRIQMGNDEFILHIRKNTQSKLTTDQLGKRIWTWLKDQKDAKAVKLNNGKQKQCYWGDEGKHISEAELPKTATQFEFNIEFLPSLYDYLLDLGNNF